VDKPWNDSDLARLSADLDDELTAIFEQVETDLSPENGQWVDIELDEPVSGASPAEAESNWLEPELLGEPESSAGFTPEAIRELSRIIEEAVEKGVTAALAKMKDQFK